MKNVLGLAVVLLVASGAVIVIGGALWPPTPVEAPAYLPAPGPTLLPKMCLTFGLMAEGEGGWMRVADQELCGYNLEWGVGFGPSLEDALTAVENERDAWRDCAVDAALCTTLQKEWKDAP